MNGFILSVWNIALVLEAADDASGIAGFFGRGTSVFRCLTHTSYYMPAAPGGRGWQRRPPLAIRSRRPLVAGHVSTSIFFVT
jgi:hypothetical protein